MLDAEPAATAGAWSVLWVVLAVLRLADIDPAANYLVRVKGREQESFQGRGDDPIHVHEHEVFVSVSTGPAPTS